MNENHQERTGVTLLERKHVVAFALDDDDDDDMDIDLKSSTDSDDTLTENHNIDYIANDRVSEDTVSVSIPKMKSVNGIKHKRSIAHSLPSKTDGQTRKIIPKAVYNYATLFHQASEEPHQSRLDQDVMAVFGSSDPPPGFGVLHPRIHYLKQRRPFPLEPLPVWRGYNGNIYFSPIQVKPLESERPILYTKSLKSASTSSIPSIRKTKNNPSTTVLHTNEIRNSIEERNHYEPRIHIGTITDTKIMTMDNEFENDRLHISTEAEDGRYESTKIRQSVFLPSHSRLKPILKQNQHTVDDLYQESLLHDPLTHSRQVLPNIRPVAKPKFVHKGLAYRDNPRFLRLDIENTTENDSNVSQQGFNLTEAYTPYGIDVVRAKQKCQQLPSIGMTITLAKDQQSFDVREKRKRIIKGSTTSHRMPKQSMAWMFNQTDHKSTSNSQILSSAQTSNPLNHTPASSVSVAHQQKHNTVNTTPNLSQYFEKFPTNNNSHIS